MLTVVFVALCRRSDITVVIVAMCHGSDIYGCICCVMLWF